MNMHVSGVYVIRHKTSGKVYVGSSGDVLKRWWRHRSDLVRYRHSSEKLQRAWNKYGAEAFEMELLEACTVQSLREREQYWMDTLAAYTNGYNCTRKALEHSDEVRTRLANQKRGGSASEETKRRMSESHKLRTPRTDQLHTAEARAKSAANRVGLVRSEVTRKKMSASGTGKHSAPRGPMSEETKRRIGAGNRGKKHTEETKAKLRTKVISDETRRRMSEAAKQRCKRSKHEHE